MSETEEKYGSFGGNEIAVCSRGKYLAGLHSQNN